MNGYAAFFQSTKTLPFFCEIHKCWQTAVHVSKVDTPKGLNADSIAEQEQIESFFIELRHGAPVPTLKKYFSLIERRSKDQVFLTAVGRTIEGRSIPNDAPPPLPHYILAAWIHGFLWGLSNEHRADLLCRVCGVPTRSAVGDQSEVVRKTIAKLKLKSWSDYREAYSKPPLSLVLFGGGQHEEYQIVLNWTGQSWPKFCPGDAAADNSLHQPDDRKISNGSTKFRNVSHSSRASSALEGKSRDSEEKSARRNRPGCAI